MQYIFTSESVSEGHPDKVCDQVSDAVLDEVLSKDPTGRVACECFATTGMIVVGGEITTTTYIDLPEVVRGVIRDIGYDRGEYRFEADSCAVINVINRQSPDIAQGVNTGGAGDQGMMFGYATAETDEYMPAALYYSHKLVKRLADIRKTDKILMPYLRPDAKAQVSVVYGDNGEVVRVDTIVVSTQHDPMENAQARIREDVIENVVKAVIPEHLITAETKYHVNPTGKFEIGGPHGDTGLTGRKIIVDTYGGRAPHGGGAFSGKDPTKVDRSAAYAARHLAKNIVAAGVARECTIQLAYAIGVAEPVSININLHGTSKVNERELEQFIMTHPDMSLTPAGIIARLHLQRAIYRPTAAYGHFGRHEFPWEHLDLRDVFAKNFA
ncbi:MAG: methionine adenosyltransferase [Ignavibacteria bacterium]|nr:methionine adenosyltransferase [Ignavibacteria bacterium]MBP6510790.1 methionine adenosyltransferase [Candidatus Kapabacteria bacterium]MBK6419592.1 methionine adenosyltransferase [Ignavibacteria bacterium]MBK6759785.1 methionine adenosyltransferase [Ignavibacteria bacterium]MBK7033030.1 methionine adenosyltransferase [Ignavibacteria bacterium]